MERNREARRSATTTAGATHSVARRPRVKDASDEEDRMEEALDPRMWERPKKERLATFHVTASSNPRNKRKRQGQPHESQVSGGRLHAVAEDADESFEETEAHASEDDDEPPPPPFLRRPGKARAHAKEDEIVMDIPAVPRKARSSISASSRYSSIARRQPEPQPPEVFRQKYATPSQTPLNGNSSPNFLQKQGRKLKPVGPKVRVMKVQKVAEAASTYSDQEAEVAEALFDLSRSIPGMLDSKVEVKLEAEARTDSPPIGHPVVMGSPMPHISGFHHTGSTANGYVSSHLKDLTASSVEAPKKKRPRVVVKPEDGRASTPVRLVASGAVSSSASPSIQNQPCLSETQPESQPEKTGADLASLASDSLKVNVATDSTVTEEKKLGVQDCEDMEQGEFIPKQEFQNVVDTGERMSDRLGEGAIAAHLKGGIDGVSKRELDNRPIETLREEGSSSKMNIDLMASPLKHCGVEEDGSGSTIDKTVGDNSFNIAGGFDGQQQLEDQSKKNLMLEDAAKAMDIARELSKITGKLNVEKLEFSKDEEQQARDLLQKEQTVSHSGREEEERERESSSKTMSRAHEEVSDNAGAPPFVSSTLPTATSSSAPVALAGWMGGLPSLGYYGPGASPWAAGASLPNPGLDVKAAHSAMQLPHGPILSPVPRMKRCATHVFMAHFIYREQQVSRHSLWSAALCRAAPYNLNIPPVNMLDNDKLGGHYLDAARKASASQSGPSYGYTISQGVGPGMAGSSNVGAAGAATLPNHSSNAGGSGDTSNVAGSGSASTNVMAAHAQYLQAMMQQNGFASFPFPFNGPPSQAAQFFNSHFFPPHLMPPPLPHLQPLTQQSGNVLPTQKQQQGVGSLPHSNSSQLVAPPLQQQLQLQLAPQSPSRSHQQHNQVGMSAQQFGIHTDKESTAAEIASTAESRLSAMQRSMSAQGPSNLPNLNMSASSLMLGSNLPGMPLSEQDGPSLVPSSGKQSGKGQQQFQGQSPASFSSSMQAQQFTGGAAPGLQMKVMDPMLSQGYSAIRRGATVNPGSLGLVSSMMGTPSLGVLPGSMDSTKGPAQQQPLYGGHGQHFQRSMTKVPSASDDAYAVKTRDYADEKKNSMKPAGGGPLLSRVDMEGSLPSVQGSPTSGSGASHARITGGVGRTLNSVPPQDARTSRPASSSGSGHGQVPLLQNQPAQKQAVGRAKSGPGSTNVATTVASHSVAAYAERVLPGNLGKFPGTGLPYSGQMATTSQSLKPGQAGGAAKVGQRMSPGPTMPNTSMAKSHAQQARGNQPGVPSTPPRMLPSATAPILSGGTIPMSTSHSLSVSKASTISTSKSPSNGKGSLSMTKAGPPTKKPPGSGPAISSVVSPGQNMSRAPALQKSPASAVHISQFQQQQPSISAQQQQRLATTKNPVYPQLQPQQGQYKQQQPFQAQSPYRPQIFLQQHQPQYMQQQSPSQQQQAVPPHSLVPISHQYPSIPQNSASQHSQASQQLSHLQQQFQPVSSAQPMTGTNCLPLSSPNLTLGTAVSGNVSSSASSDGGGSKSNPAKTAYASGNPLPSGGMPEVITTTQSTVSGQANSPHSGSSPYLQLAPVKPNEQKPPDAATREDMASAARHLASPSSSQAAAASNPSSL